MPSEDFEVVRAAWDGFSRGRLQDVLEHLHPDVELVPFGAAMEGRSYCGYDGVRTWWEEDIQANWETFETHAEHCEQVGEVLVVYGHWRARGRTSGVDLDMPATWVVDVREGRIVRWQTYTDRDEALRDARARSR